MLLNVGTLKPHDLVRSEIPSKNLFSDRKFHLATATYTAGSSATSFVSDLTGKAWHLNAYLGGNQAKIEIYLGNTLKTPIPRLNRSTLWFPSPFLQHDGPNSGSTSFQDGLLFPHWSPAQVAQLFNICCWEIPLTFPHWNSPSCWIGTFLVLFDSHPRPNASINRSNWPSDSIRNTSPSRFVSNTSAWDTSTLFGSAMFLCNTSMSLTRN